MFIVAYIYAASEVRNKLGNTGIRCPYQFYNIHSVTLKVFIASAKYEILCNK